MSSGGNEDRPDGPERETDSAGPNNDSMASKLSKELSDWRLHRSTAAKSRRRPDGPAQSFSSEPARTIRVRGHETLVVRKPKLANKPTPTPSQTPSNQ
ncbi:MAG: hypothetical protein ACREQI_06570 [Candidatus Binataceae bacterium]